MLSPKVPDILLVWLPTVVVTTLTLTVQLPNPLVVLAAAGTVAPDRLMLPAPAVAVTEPPAQLVEAVGVAATTIPDGKVSVSVTPLKAVRLRFWSVSVNVETATPLAKIEAGTNPLVRLPPVSTEKELLLMSAALLAPSVVVTVPAASVLVTRPFGATVFTPVTVNVTVQLPDPAIVPPLRLANPAPGVAVTVPPQDVEVAGMAAIARPVGKLSVKETLFRLWVLGLFSVIVTVEVPPP